MKKTLIYLIIFLSNLCFSQSSPERNYLYEKNKIIKVEIYEITNLGIEVDSVLKNVYLYDTLGRLIEKRFDYNKLNTKYVSHKYKYNEKGGYSFIVNNPYVLYGISLRKKDLIKKKIIYYDEFNRINYEIVEFQNVCKKQRIDYMYNSEGFLTEIIKSINGKVISRIVYFYTTLSSF